MAHPRPTYCAAFIALLLACDSFAQSIGYWHLPSTVPQYCGFGCGPGHHVPMIRTHGCEALLVPRRVHTHCCPSGGMAYCGGFGGSCESPNCHAELDALVTPEANRPAPEPAVQLFSYPSEENSQVLPTPPEESQTSPHN